MKRSRNPVCISGLLAIAAIVAGLSWPAESEVEESPVPIEVVTEIAAVALDRTPPVQKWQIVKVSSSTESIPVPVKRYAAISMSEAERDELAATVWLEAGNQSPEGQQAVAEVVLNRVISEEFPGSVHGVLHQGRDTAMPQFTTARNLSRARPGPEQYAAVDAALHGPSLLPADVVYFSQQGENDHVWGRIGGHVFCRGYVWE